MRVAQVALVLILISFSWPVHAQLTASGEQDFGGKGLDVVSIKGVAEGGTLVLEIIPGPVATHALRVYSEPSHRLLAVVEDSRFASSEEGKIWRQESLGDPQRAAQVSTQLPAGRVRLTIEKRLPTDDRIATWVYGSWPDGKVDERLIGDGVVGSGSFEFSISVGGESFSWPAITHCCNGGGCNMRFASDQEYLAPAVKAELHLGDKAAITQPYLDNRDQSGREVSELGVAPDSIHP